MSPERDVDLAELPEAIAPQVEIAPPNMPSTIYEGKLTLSTSGRSIDLDGAVRQRWVPTARVVFDGSAPACKQALDPEVNAVELRAPGFSLPAHVLARSSGTEGLEVAGQIQGSIRIPLGGVAAADHIDFQLTNFHDYVGALVRTKHADGTGYSRSRIAFSARGWKVIVDQVPDYRTELGRALASGGLVSGHAGRLYRTSAKEISADSARDFLRMLHFFFDFLRGCCCGPILATGHDTAGDSWREWGAWRLTPARRHIPSWFPCVHADDASMLLAPFRRLWRQPAWNDGLRTAIHWYVHGNAEAGAVEGSIVASFMALELLAWLHVVEATPSQCSATTFNSLTGAEKLSKLLQSCGIPTSIPARCKQLKRAARTRGWADGPEALNGIRNCIIHPKSAKRARLRSMSVMAIYQAKKLALGYFELALLSLLGYRGRYAQRGIAARAAEQIVKVPWVAAEARP